MMGNDREGLQTFLILTAILTANLLNGGGAVADPGGGGGYPPQMFFFFLCLSVYENSRGPGP